MKRLFFALWPDDQTRAQIDALNHSIDEPGRKLVPDNLHITLVFLGNVEEDIARAVQRDAAMIQGSPITLQFDELDYWRRPRVMCLTCHRQPKNLYSLVNALTKMLESYPLRLDKRHYRAHITLARKAQRRPAKNFKPITVHAKDFALVESVSTERGVRYDVLEKWPLKA
ncbi:RNA 2',3'-cyclic phosphodiesterase [Methylophaga sp.]|jgi:2'-5' RNA ligase|uniref:RNA 2',3'-cyclic phosphodiesterase n=1 Tax=Methylophaga sp. TaxID=2024840 RepID=UPI0014010C5B|nr:RNA 2',3'-cyclic phosphodiesterase [Methylophaga sp.]MTI64542.1 RNA 2',3'-cyclic phosphodiesterase [Methylophaga sp.]